MQCPQRIQLQAKYLIDSTIPNKLDELKKLGRPIRERHAEAAGRTKAFEDLCKQIQWYTKAVEAYKAKEERYEHLDEAEVGRVSPPLKLASSLELQLGRYSPRFDSHVDDATFQSEAVRARGGASSGGLTCRWSGSG